MSVKELISRLSPTASIYDVVLVSMMLPERPNVRIVILKGPVILGCFMCVGQKRKFEVC